MIVVLLITAGVFAAISGFWGFVAVMAAYYIGIFGWAQIIGSIQHRRERTPKATFTTISIWIIILGAITAFVCFVLPKLLTAYLVGLGIALIQISCIKNIE